MCPKCNGLMRLSDLHLRAKVQAPKTWLDKYELQLMNHEKKEEKFKDQESKIREEARARGRKKVPRLIKKSMDEKFAKLKYDPYDIKALLHPIDFVIFNGMNKNKMKDVVLLSKKTSNKHILQHHKEISNAVKNRNYDWKVVRVSENGEVEYE